MQPTSSTCLQCSDNMWSDSKLVCSLTGTRRIVISEPTFGYLHICDILPLVHRYEPLFPSTTTAIHQGHEGVICTQRAGQPHIHDQPVPADGVGDGIKSLSGEFRSREEV
jgi:hypothetical protein